MSTPAAFPASRIDVPSGTVTWRPSIVNVTIASGRYRRGSDGCSDTAKRTTLLADVRLELIAEFGDPRYYGRRAGIAQHTDRLPGHVVGDRQQGIEILHRSAPRLDALDDL